MKRATFWLTIGLIVGVLAISNVVSAEDYGRYDRRYDRNDNWWERWKNTRDDRA